MSILVKFSKNFDFGQIFEKISISGQNFRKFRKNVDFSKKFR